MRITPYADVDELLRNLRSKLHQILGQNLVGLYLYGSLVTGDFDREISDIDLLAVTLLAIDDQEFDRLQHLHDDLATSYPAWKNRIEIAYLSVVALRTYKSQASKIAIISPGEPFHVKDAGKDWLINWWVVREHGISLLGPTPDSLIAPISKEEFRAAVYEQVQAWRGYIPHTRDSRPYQAYAILTLCRALYVATHGEQVSKKQAALWAAQHFTAWSPLIHNALAWRTAWQDQTINHEATFPETAAFVHFVSDHMAST